MQEAIVTIVLKCGGKLNKTEISVPGIPAVVTSDIVSLTIGFFFK